MANWNNPTVDSLYTDYTTELKDRDVDLAKGMDPAKVTVTNPQTDFIRWNSANHYWERYNGSSWVALDSTYAINISGSAGSVAFANVTGKPTTLSGYGITDAQPLDSDLTAVAGLGTTGLISRTGSGTMATRSIVAPAAGITVSNGDGVSGNPTLALANDLNALESMSGTGIAVRTATSTWTTRSIVQPAAGITVSNADGIAGNPTLALANDLAALEGLAGTGIAVRTGSDAWAQRSIVGTANEVTVTNGSGAGGNPTISLPSAMTFTGKTVTGGTFSSPTINTPSILSPTITGTVSGGTYSGATFTNPANTDQTLSAASATINWDMNNGAIATVTLGSAGPYTMAAPTNLKKGTIILKIIQDATGGRLINTWNSVWKFSGGVKPVLSTAGNAVDIISGFCDGANIYASMGLRGAA